MSMVFQHAPNKKTARYSTAGTGWILLASDGTAHASVAALNSASKYPYPNLDAGAFLQYLILQSENGSGASGSGFYYKVGGGTAPSDLSEAEFTTGRAELPGPASYLWLKKVTSGDVIVVTGGY